MKGQSGIPALRLTTMNKLVSMLPPPPTMFFSNLFSTQNYDSDTIEWDIEYGSGGMTPFVAPGAVAPAIGIDGVGEGNAKAAFYKEKMYFGEEFLNNMKKPGTHATYQKAERHLAKGLRKLSHRLDRRREWMFAKMILDGNMTYLQKGGVKFTVNYGMPASHFLTLAADRRWGTGASRNPVEDIFDAKQVLAQDAGVGSIEFAIANSETIKKLLFDAEIQALLHKSAFGQGDLFSNTAVVLGTLLGVGTIMIYDELYEVPAYITGPVTGGATTDIPVDDASDMEIGGTLRFYDMSQWNVWEDCTIDGVDVEAGTVSVAVAPTNSYVAGQDKVTMKKKFIPDDKFVLMNTMKDGEKVAEFLAAPYGLGRRWGRFTDRKDEWDPEGLWLRIQDKGLPVLYNPDTTFTLTV
jgi:hypothetical protein